VLQPVLIDKKNRIISGHRRVAAARQARQDEIPVTVFPSADEGDIAMMLIESNLQRVKTKEQAAREAACLFKIEQEKAKVRRSQANAKKDVPLKSSGVTGDARDLVGRKLGICGQKVDHSVAVVGAIDSLRNQGKKSEAENLRLDLNNHSVSHAYDFAMENGWVKGSAFENQARLLKKVPAEQLGNVMARAKALAGTDKIAPEHFVAAIQEVCPAALSPGKAEVKVVALPTLQDAQPVGQIRKWVKEAMDYVKNDTKKSETLELLGNVISALIIIDNTNNAQKAA
jgi:hypothetical protein